MPRKPRGRVYSSFVVVYILRCNFLLLLSIMGFLNPDSIGRGGGGVHVVRTLPNKAFSVGGDVCTIKLTLECENSCST